MKPIVFLESGRVLAERLSQFVIQSLIIYKKIGKEETFAQYLLFETLLGVLNKVFNIKKLQYKHKKYNGCRAQHFFFLKVNSPMVNFKKQSNLNHNYNSKVPSSHCLPKGHLLTSQISLHYF